MYRNTYVEVNVNNIEDNVKKLIATYPEYKYYFGVVKSNGYGHSHKISKYIIECGINYLAVSSLEEAIEIRKLIRDIPILCLEPISIEFIYECIRYNITITVHSPEYLKLLLEQDINKRLKVHLKIDSGMSRLGFINKEEIKQAYETLIDHQYLELEGVFSHFATSGVNDKEWDNQVTNFLELTSLIDLKKVPIVHMAKSVNLLNHEKLPFCNGVRIGATMYGYDQTPRLGNGIKGKLREVRRNYFIKKFNISPTNTENHIMLKPAFNFYSEVIQVKKISAGTKVGYGATYEAKEDEYIAVVPVGYADGYRRGNLHSYVIINTKKYPVIGDVSMGMITIKVDKTVKTYDRVTLIGEGIGVKEVAHHLKTTSMEVLCMVDRSVPIVLIRNNKLVDIDEK
ncbi:MAG: alanine racemase [Bacilli bacterium]|nr:alanine racemase [Bacilli bacterium]